MAMGISEDIGMASEDKAIKSSLLSEKMDSVFKQVNRLEKLIGLNKNLPTEKLQETPIMSKFDGFAHALDEIQTRLAQCNVEVEKL